MIWIPLIYFCEIFQEVQPLHKALREALTQTALCNYVVKRVGHFNGVKYVSSTTNNPFSSS